MLNVVRAKELHLLCGITHCYLPPNTSKRSPTNPNQRDSINLYPEWMEGWVRYILRWLTYLNSHSSKYY